MVVLLVVLTFVVLIAIGAVIEYGPKKVGEKEGGSSISINPVFAQDGGEKLDKENSKENKEE